MSGEIESRNNQQLSFTSGFYFPIIDHFKKQVTESALVLDNPFTDNFYI